MSERSSERIKVLNIVGCGRSGSTILGDTLGQLSGYVHVGELCYVWNRGILRNALCGCGQPFADCEFWRRVLERSGISVSQEDASRLSTYPRRANRRMAVTFLGGRGPLALADGIAEYLEALRRLYRAIHAETGCRVVVDSTKAPSHSYLLRETEDLDVRVVHLVRDARAVAHSWTRHRSHAHSDPDNAVLMPRFSPMRSAVKWAYANLTVELLRTVHDEVLTVRYEDFIEDPPGTVARITELVGEHSTTQPFVSPNQVRIDTTHTVWGNPSRQRTGVVELRSDVEWRQAMGLGARAVVTGITWPLQLRYARARSGALRSSNGESAAPGVN